MPAGAALDIEPGAADKQGTMPTPLPDPHQAPAPAGAGGRLAALRARLAPRWLNAPPLLAATAAEGAPPELLFIEPALADRVVLLVFWDMSCALSLRTVPFLAAWHRRYVRFGLTIIGIHAPEFSFGRERAHVEREVRRLGIAYPVLLDNDFAVSRALDNQIWPRTILLDRSGQVVLDHAGPAGYAQIATHIVAALAVAPAGVTPLTPLPAPAAPRPLVTTLPATPDLYCGMSRAGAEISKRPTRGPAVHYLEEPDRAGDRLYRSGPWRTTRESWIAAPAPGAPAILRVRATAAEIGAVLSGDPAGTDVRVLVDGRPVRREQAGADVIRPDETAGRRESICRVAEPRLYRLVRGPVHTTVELCLLVMAAELEVFVLRFQGGLAPARAAAAPEAGPRAV
jgi:thiol-disulfide isomerase/thioredoxin